MKKTLSVLLAAALLAGCTTASSSAASSAETSSSDETVSVNDFIDPAYTQSLQDQISSFGDNPDIGNRSAGSDAEADVIDLVYNTFSEIGLQNVEKEAFSTDSWSFNKSRLYYTDENGEQQYIALGGYATEFVADMQDYQLVYVNKGTAADYEDIDVEGKIVLVDIDQWNDWWINFPAYQGHVKGAALVIACNTSGYAQYDEYTTGSQDICGPYDAPAMAISKHDSQILQNLISENGGEITVTMDAESLITLDTESYNVIGEIPGTTDEVVYYFAHMDGYYHSYFDDAQGLAEMISIAKAMVEAGIQPEKTIRFVAHAGEEWGDTDTEFDWSEGAWKQIKEVHPEWAETAFVILNIDGMYAVDGQKDYRIACSYPLADYAQSAVDKVNVPEGYTLEVLTPTTTYTEDFGWQRYGVPAIVASGTGFLNEPYRNLAYHSSMDNKVLGVDDDAQRMTMELFAAMGIELAGTGCRPMNFAREFEAMEETYEGDAIDFRGILEASEELYAKIVSFEEAYQAAEGDEKEALKEEAQAFNKETWQIFKQIKTDLMRFDYAGDIIFPHEIYQNNIAALEGAIAALEDGNAAEALDEYLYDVDYNWYAYDFDYETFSYMADKFYAKSEGTWGEGMLEHPSEDLYDLIHSLNEKYDDENADVSAELAELKTVLERQQTYLSEKETEEQEQLDDIEAMIRALLD